MAKIECGTLFSISKDGIEYRGQIQLGSRLNGVLILRKHRRAGTSDEHPDLTVEYTDRAGMVRPLGAAWIKNGDRVGDFITMTLDDPDWSSPTYLTAFPPNTSRGETLWTIVWSRPRGAHVTAPSPAAQVDARHGD